MSYLIPGWEIGENDKKQFRKVTYDILTRRALVFGIVRAAKPMKSVNELLSLLTVRKIEPKDLGLDNWVIKQEDWINHQVTNNSILAIYKFSALSLDPVAQHIYLRMGMLAHTTLFSADLAEMYAGLNLIKALYKSDYDTIRVTEELEGKPSSDLEKMMANKTMQCEAYLSEPCIYDPQQYVNIRISPACHDTLVIVGFVAEPAGMTTI